MSAFVPVHPGCILDELFLKPLEWSGKDLSRRLAVDSAVVEDVLAERRGFDGDLVVRLARLFGTTEDYWFRFQNVYDAHEARQRAAAALNAIEPVNREAA